MHRYFAHMMSRPKISGFMHASGPKPEDLKPMVAEFDSSDDLDTDEVW